MAAGSSLRGPPLSLCSPVAHKTNFEFPIFCTGGADMERGLARLATAAAGTAARDGAGVVLYEDAARRRVAALASALASLRTLADVAAGFAGDDVAGCVLSRWFPAVSLQASCSAYNCPDALLSARELHNACGSAFSPVHLK